MTLQPSRVLFATDQPTLPMRFRAVLRLSGFDAETVTLRPHAALATLGPEDAFLIFVNANCAPAPGTLAQAVRGTTHSRFVLAGRAITPEMLLTAIEAGIHGVLATGLPVEEAAQALLRIWRGERQFRFDCGPTRRIGPPPPARADFDSAWMLGQAV